MSIALQNSTSNNASRHHHNIHNLLTNLPSLLLKLVTCALINHSFVHLICLLLSLLPHQILIGNKKASTLYTCAAYNHELKEPNPEPTWFHNGQAIRPSNAKGFTFENHGKTLVFNVTAEHIGRYDCKFEKHPSSYDRSFDIKVNAAPYWHDQPPPNVNTSEGETVTFDCKSSGNPTPTVTFYKNGVEMRKPRPGENWVIDGSKLTIFDVKQGVGGVGDNAVYQCKVENKHGYLWTNFYLNLLAFQPKLMEEEPGQVEAIQGRPFSLSCKFFASPLAKVAWESPVLKGADYSMRVDQFGTGWLVFENVLPSYEGEYKCTGTNKYGSASGNIKLVVRKPTKLDQFIDQRMERRAGLPIRLACLAEHDTDLDIQYVWTINGKKLDQVEAESGHFRVLEDNTLEVERPTQEDSGVYTCVASTKLDSASKSVTVVIEDVPPPVSSARILECNQTDPVVTITSSGCATALRQVNGRLSIMLKPFGTYAFQLIARNAIGDSAAYNIEGVCQTAQKAPSRNPSGVRVVGTQPDNLIVYWDPMARDEWNGEKFAYKIFYRRKDEDGPWRELVVEDPFADKFTIDLGDSGTRAWDPYEVQVRAMNGKGLSKISPEVVEGRTGEGDPGVTPTNFRLKEVSATSAEFEWDPVDPSRVQGNFTGYKITYWYDENEEHSSDVDGTNVNSDGTIAIKKARRKRKTLTSSSPGAAAASAWRLNHHRHGGIHRRSLSTSGGLSRKSMIFSMDVMRGTVVGLKPNSMNFAVISVLNGQNEGTPSQELSFRTKEGVPTAVRDLHAYPMNFMVPTERAVVVLKWHPPRTLNGRLTSFGIKHCRAEPGASVDESDELTQCTDALFVSPPVNELRIVHLDYDTNYRFIVTAHTSAGEGLPNSVDARTLPEMLRLSAEPSRPSLAKEGIGEDHFNITFVPGTFDDASGAPVGNAFFVRYRETDDDTSAAWHEKHPTDKSTLQVWFC
uniref:Neuroglian n=1 Tax=Globodera pallida TaxID=36090 RepID=A0A183BR96_GLOPA